MPAAANISHVGFTFHRTSTPRITHAIPRGNGHPGPLSTGGIIHSSVTPINDTTAAFIESSAPRASDDLRKRGNRRPSTATNTNDGAKIADGKNKGKQFEATAIYATPGYFDTLRMHVLAGRDFNAGDTTKSQPVAIVNESFAREYLDRRNAVGRHLGGHTDDSRPIEVIGVVSDVVKTPAIDSTAPLATEPTVYIPATQVDSKLFALVHTWFQPSWIVRTRGPIAGITGAMQKALADADPTLPFAGFYSMSELETQDLGMQRIEVMLLGVLAGLALLLSAIGVYGLIANLVVQRKREIGIRLALGSSIRAAMLEIGRSGVLATMLGLGLGLAASFLALRAMKGFIYGIGMYDPATLIGTALVLAIVAVAATFLPARRISKINPTTILREE